MRWKFRKLFPPKNADENYSVNRSEEVRDIIDRMPRNFGRGVAIAVMCFAFLFFLFGWIIKYPDAVSGSIKINSTAAPVKLVCNVSGKVHTLNFHPQDTVKEGEYIAIVQNSAVTEDVRIVKEKIKAFNPNVDSVYSSIPDFPVQVSLGELNVKYYTFLSALQSRGNYERANVFERQMKNLEVDIVWQKQILKETEKILKTAEEKIKILRKWDEKYKYLNQKEAIHEFEYDRSKNEYLTELQNLESLSKEIFSIKKQLSESENRFQQIKIEQAEKERQLKMDLLLSYQDMVDNLKLWEQKYVFIAPFDGKVEFLKFLTPDQFIQSGEEIFSVIPKENMVLGQMFLPASGAGKVKVGSRVVIKLENYPYNEFGSVEGQVGTISLISQQLNVEQSRMNMYLVAVNLPHGLTTNYGRVLDFKYEIGGTADIIVQERRLIERLFDNLRYSVK